MKKRNYFPLAIVTVLISGFTFSSYASKGNGGWSATDENPKAFIENKGQFHIHNSKETVLYAYDDGTTMIYFTSQGITYSFLKRWKKEEKENEREHENSKGAKSHAEMEAEEHRMEFKTDAVNFIWENANTAAVIVPEEETKDYYSYTLKEKDGSVKNVNNIKGYKKLVYKNLYPGIDVEYVFHPDEGIKYTLIVQPGADISKVKMNYGNGAAKIKLNGSLHIPALFGDIIDHAPSAFYSDNKSEAISSHFTKTDKSISFELGAYDHSKTIVIDPWVQTPSMSNSNCVWECEKDGAGNVYIIGGDMPMKLRKYNAAGVIQWTYITPWDTAGQWLGTFATDLAGNSYVTNGSTAALQKINTGGSMVYNAAGGSLDEYWNIAFNCDQTKLIVGGTRLGMLPPAGSNGMIFDINTSNGSVSSTKKVGYNRSHVVFGFPVTDIEEVRSITSSRNSKYYFLTLDTIGAIDQNFAACPNGNIFNINDTYAFSYKCENFRPNNGNAGIMAIRANKNFVYTQNGANIQKRSLGTGAVLATAAIAGGINTSSGGLNQAGNSGIDIDSCGNVYVGSGNSVIKYDANLNVITSVSLPFSVFDVAVSYSGNVIVCGATGNSSNHTRTGYVQSINMSACDPMILFCCDATICPAGPLCIAAAPITLTPATAGGTWSGVGVNASTGVFTPSVAGVGSHVIIYTLSCGSDSTTIIVSPCLALTACHETNGNITVTSGTGPYTWTKDSTFTDCSTCFGGNCIPGFCTGTTATISTTFATGTTVTPPGTYPIHVTDSGATSLTITSLSSLPACSNTCPALTVTPSSIVMDSCFGQSAGSFSAATSGGASPWDYTLVNSGGTTVASFANVVGTQSFTGLPAGTYTLNVLDNNACPGTASVIITQPAAGTAANAGIDQTICSNSTFLEGNIPAAGTGLWTIVSGTGTITTPSSPTSGVTGLGVGTIILAWTITNPPCPPTSDQVSIINSGGTAANAGPDQTICASSAVLAGNSPVSGTGVWTLIGGTGTITSPNSPTSLVTGLGVGSLVLEWTINNPPCPASADQVTITNTGVGPAVSISSHINVSCYGGSNGSANAAASGGAGTLTYAWTASGGNSMSAHNLAAGTYTVTVTDSIGCTGAATVPIIQPDSIHAHVTTTATACGTSTGSAAVTAGGGTGNLTYSWGSGGTAATINNIGAGLQTVTVTDSAGCTKTASGTVVSNGAPTAAAGPNITITAGTSAQLNSSGGGTYLWTPPAGLNCDTCRAPIASPAQTTSYCVTVSKNGCSDSACVTVIVTDSLSPAMICGTLYLPVGSVYVPNAFTPNNNDLLNDVFKPVANCVHDYSFMIFDRWGEKIFETTDKDAGWNGYYKGVLCKADIYVYKITFTDDPRKDFHQYIGYVTLLK